MFKPSRPVTEPDLFTYTDHFLGGPSAAVYGDPTAWHNQFHKHIKSRIDESIFEVLFDQRTGAPNASVSVLVSMMILKELFGWSDQQLFENCRFHMLVRRALGLMNIDDPVPVESTYYLFRKRMYAYQRTSGQDLMEHTFRGITTQQMRTFEVNGKQLRMDSKLFSSNIAWYSRYELIHRSLIAFCKHLDDSDFARFSAQQRDQLKALLDEKPSKVVYEQTKPELGDRLQRIGVFIDTLLKTFSQHTHPAWELLKRVFDEQYSVEHQPEQTIVLRPKEQICSDSVQSPDDPDCAYRNKGNQQIKGYVANITETTADQPLNLISDVRVDKANTNDTTLLTPALQASEQVTGHTPERVYVDGAYQSPDHDQHWPDTDMVYTGIQGGTPRYEHTWQADTLMVTDTQTGQTYPANLVKKHKKSSIGKRWSIQPQQGKRIYFDEKAIRAAAIRRQMKQRPLAQRQARNNVEATIYHLFCKMTGGKSPYRGLAKQATMVFCKALGVNLHRIMKFEATNGLHSLVFTLKTRSYKICMGARMVLALHISTLITLIDHKPFCTLRYLQNEI